MDSFQKLNKKQLPPKSAFYCKLNDEGIKYEDYTHAQKVWKVFNVKSMRDYRDLYLKMDVLLSADVFENFREMCLKNYKLDPTHYFTASGLVWDAALKTTGITLDLLTDYDILLMVEKVIEEECP